MKKSKGYMGGGKLKKQPKMMASGGPTALKNDMKKSKGMAAGGVFVSSGAPIPKKTAARGSGAARTQYFRKNG
tara:strand:+ start:271 stop:489 length:219 start_codon:yes stop_codon:yes gene_type:complete